MSATSASEIKKAMDKIHQHNLQVFSEPFEMEPYDFDPVIYENEPYDVPETLSELVEDWLATLNTIREIYLETEDERYASILYDLLPAGIYTRLN